MTTMLDKLKLLYQRNDADRKGDAVMGVLKIYEEEALALREVTKALVATNISFADQIEAWAELGITVRGYSHSIEDRTGWESSWMVSFRPDRIEHKPHQEIACNMGGDWGFNRLDLTFVRVYYQVQDVLHNVADDVRKQMAAYSQRIENYRQWDQFERAKKDE